jgi:hypothetical protein
MSYVFTYTTKIKNKNYNQSLCKYISDWTIIFNKIQRKVWQQIKAEYKETGEIKGKFITVLSDDEIELTARTKNSIFLNMAGRFQAIKELKNYELDNIDKRLERIEEDITEIKERIQELKYKHESDIFGLSDKEKEELKNTKHKLYWKLNRKNKLFQRRNNLDKEIKEGNFKLCFGTKYLLKNDYNKFVKQRDSELFFVGRTAETGGNNNFQLEYNSKKNNFRIKVRKEISLDDSKYEYGEIYFNQKRTKQVRQILKNKSSALTYRIKIKNDEIYLQLMFTLKHTVEDCLTRSSNGVFGIDFNKGFISVTETDKQGNMIQTYNLDYRFGSGNKTKNDLEIVTGKVVKEALEKGKDVVVEKLDFKVKRSELISKKGKKYNEMLSSLPYSIYGSIVKSKCAKNKVYLHQVNPAWTSYIGNIKYSIPRKMNIHTAASFVIARRGMKFIDSIGKKKMRLKRKKRKKYEKRKVNNK